MKAVIIGNDRNLRLDTVPAPQGGPDRVLIDIRAAGVNRADLLQVDGKYPPPPGWPDWPGLECAGVVAEAPAGSRHPLYSGFFGKRSVKNRIFPKKNEKKSRTASPP